MMTWEESIKRGKNLVSRTSKLHWELGDLLVETFPVGGNQGRRKAFNGTSLKEAVGVWAKEVGFEGEVGTLYAYRYVSRRWPVGKRNENCSWAVHQILTPHPNRFNLIKDGMNVDEARLASGKRSVPPKVHTAGELRTIADALHDMGAAASFLRSAERVLSAQRISPSLAREIADQHARVVREANSILDILRPKRAVA